MGTTQSRRDKIIWMNETLKRFFFQRPKQPVSKERLLAEFVKAHGSTVRTGEEILGILDKTEMIKVDDDDIWERK